MSILLIILFLSLLHILLPQAPIFKNLSICFLSSKYPFFVLFLFLFRQLLNLSVHKRNQRASSMEANKFATMLGKNTNRITLILAYTFLEWILIVLLLLNSLFSYLIIKFVDYFGLKRPCLWCTRLDHIFEPSNYNNSYRDLVCDDHANEISRLGYCSKHRKLEESRYMCEDCLSSPRSDCCDLSKKLAFFPWMKQIDGDKVMENSEESLKCCCCGVMLDKKLNFLNLLIKPSWEVFNYSQKGNVSDGIKTDTLADYKEDKQRVENNRIQILSDADEDDEGVKEGKLGKEENLEFFIEGDDCHLIPVELMDSVTVESQRIYRFREEDQGIGGNGDVMDNSCSSGEKVTLISPHESEDEASVAVLESMESMATHAGEEVQGNAATGEGEMSVDVNQVCDEQNDEIEAEVSIGTDIPDHEPFEDIQMHHLYEFTQEYPSISSSQMHIDADNGSRNAEEETIQFTTMTVETCDQAIKNHHKKLLLLEKKDSETEDSLDRSVVSDIECADGVWTVEKLKSALKSEKKALDALYTELEEERSASAVAAYQTMAMINRLQEERAAMQMEALQYQRMMEEQSEYDQEALQLLNELMVKREKEKAEIEKELEIYRRKVQDYETKEKMITRRRRIDDGTRSATSASCSNADDSDGRSVDLNHELKDEDSFGHRQKDSNHNTPADAILYLDEPLASFEEERLSILEQLKVLEEKMVSLNDEEEHFEDVKPVDLLFEENGNGRLSILEQLKVLEEKMVSLNDEEEHFEDVKPVDLLFEENGNGFYEISDFTYETNRVANSHFEGVNGKHHQEKIFMAANAKRLLPLFDAEIENGILNGHANGFDSIVLQPSSSANSELGSKRLAIEEEVDHVYERLQALEADREFLKHCISSLSKGDKGIYLLQEILQHLRDLRSVELRAMTIGDASI